MAHKKGLDGVYLKPTRDQCFQEFVKAVPDLMIYASERQKLKLDVLQKENTELQNKNQEINELKHKMELMQEFIRRVVSKN